VTRWPQSVGGCRGWPWRRGKFEGPKGKASLLDLFEGRRQLIVYRPCAGVDCTEMLAVVVLRTWGRHGCE